MDIGFCERCGYFEGRCECGKGRVLLKSEIRVKVSKFLSGLLRHFPHSFGLKIDENGWANLSEVERILKERYGIGRLEIELIVKFDKKGRFEIKNNKIRAKYGHSINVRTDWSESDEIPAVLYHATHPKNLQSILKFGLLPMRRKEVHMCDNVLDALEVGKRHCENPALLKIKAEEMLKKGFKIRKKGKVYTTDYVPPEFIDICKI